MGLLRGGGENSENRKMFSHREHGFPTRGEEVRDEDWLRWEARIEGDWVGRRL